MNRARDKVLSKCDESHLHRCLPTRMAAVPHQRRLSPGEEVLAPFAGRGTWDV